MYATDLVNKCMVLHRNSMPPGRAWLYTSPFHFFVRKRGQSATSSPPRSQLEVPDVDVSIREVPVCASCYKDDTASIRKLEDFASRPRNCLKAFDPFAGVGAFGLAMEQARCLKVTHAVEISPSAADTLRSVFVSRLVDGLTHADAWR